MSIFKFTHCRNFILIIYLASPAFALAQAQVARPLGNSLVEWLEQKLIVPGLKGIDRAAITPGGKWLREQAEGYPIGEFIEFSYNSCEEWFNSQANSAAWQSEKDNLPPYKAAIFILLCLGLAMFWLIRLLGDYIKRKSGEDAFRQTKS